MNFETYKPSKHENPIGLVCDLNNCKHCSLPIPQNRKSQFCCQGCETVFGILETSGLSKYYELKKNSAFFQEPTPVDLDQNSYEFLKDENSAKIFATYENGLWNMSLFLEGIHCTACIWLLEKLPEIVDEIQFVQIEISKSKVNIKVKDLNHFYTTAKAIHQMGYRPHPIQDDDSSQFEIKENRKSLLRIGVAGFSTGNIMLLAISAYAGIVGYDKLLFGWISFVLFLPVMLYSSIPFYKSAMSAIRTKTINIDVPLVLGIVFGSIASIVNLFIDSTHIYFDSISALVFLLLSSRYLLKRIQQKAIQNSKLVHFLIPQKVHKLNQNSNQITDCSIDEVFENDILEVRVGENIPVDGVVIKGTSKLNHSLLTGEFEPVECGIGSNVFAGTSNLESPLLIKVFYKGAQSRLGRILKNVEQNLNHKSPIVQLTDQISKYFLSSILILSAIIIAFGFKIGFQEAFNRALAVIIVTCPCGLALATPLTMSLILGRASRKGIYIKNAETIERLQNVDTLVFDKTGTITTGKYHVKNILTTEPVQKIANIVLSLERSSNHPIAKALIEYFKDYADIQDLSTKSINDLKETIGKGVSAKINGVLYSIQSISDSTNTHTDDRMPITTIGLFKENEKIAIIVLGDMIRNESKNILRSFENRISSFFLLSGDNEKAVQSTASTIEIPKQNAISSATPDSKAQFILQHPHAMMVGDGANDSIALSNAYVGVAVHGGMEISLKAADVYLTKEGLSSIKELFNLSDLAMKVLKRNIYLSILFNIIGISFTAAGMIHPLLAALIMPTSALTVFLSSLEAK